jgi:hypothetical protein
LVQLLFIETFVFGASTIAAVYNFVWYLQQRDKLLFYYSIHLLSLATYIAFKLLSNNYNPFLPTDNIWYYVLEEVLQGAMVTAYIIFAAQTLEVAFHKNYIRTLIFIFLLFQSGFWVSYLRCNF